MSIKKTIFVAGFACLTALLPGGKIAAVDSAITISPPIFDVAAAPGDVLHENFSLANRNHYKAHLYAVVKDMFQGQSAEGEEKAALSSWIEVSRAGLELSPGASQTVPLVIRIPRAAPAGKYYATVAFAEGSTRLEAENRPVPEGSKLTLVVEIKKPTVQKLQILAWSAGRGLNIFGRVAFAAELKNTGNGPLPAKAEIFIYDRRGREVASKVIADNLALGVGENKKIETSFEVGGFGQHKAVLRAEYGNNLQYLNQDVDFFWLVPPYLALVLTALLAAFLTILFILLRRNEKLAKHLGQIQMKEVIDLE